MAAPPTMELDDPGKRSRNRAQRARRYKRATTHGCLTFESGAIAKQVSRSGSPSSSPFPGGGGSASMKRKRNESRGGVKLRRSHPTPTLTVARVDPPVQGGDAEPGARSRRPALFSSTFAAYITPAVPQGPAMAINGRRNKPIGPGGSTRRLHPCSVCVSNPIPVGSVLSVRMDLGAASAGPK